MEGESELHQWKNNVFLRVALIGLALFCVGTILSLQLEYNQLQNQKEVLEQQIALSQMRIDELKGALNASFDDEYVIKFAREKLNYRLPEEIVFYNDLNH